MEGDRPTSKGMVGGKGKRGERIEEGKGREKRGRNVAFHHHLLLRKLTNGEVRCTERAS